MRSPNIIHLIKGFRDKFKKIPKQTWARTWRSGENGNYTYCALGHLGILGESQMTPEGKELCALLQPVAQMAFPQISGQFKTPAAPCVTYINDKAIEGVPDHPQDRIVWALDQRMAMELGQEDETLVEKKEDHAEH